MQRIISLHDGSPIFMDLPDPDAEVVPMVPWGRFDEPLTPAFWVTQAWMDTDVRRTTFALGRTLAEELVACLLGGHGAPAEVGLAAFARVRDDMAKNSAAMTEERALELLTRPLQVGRRLVRYRFAGQRARYLAGALGALSGIDETVLGDIEFRDALCGLPGIGPKTASWIVRNRRGSDEVAILDVHIVRACVAMGIFEQSADPARRYQDLERKFITFCRAAGARASILDAVMWRTMRGIGTPLMKLLLPTSNLSPNWVRVANGEKNHVGR